MSNILYDDLILVIGTLAIVNCLFGLFTVLLIYKLRLPPNFYRTILITMTIFQTGYDFFLILYFCPESDTICLDSRGVGIVACGLCATFWSNIMVFMVLYVVLVKQIFPMDRYIHGIGAVISVLSLLNGCFLMFGHVQYMAYQVYNILYVTSIVFNIIAYGVVQYHLHQMQISSSGPNGINAPIKVLANRLALYPLIQAVSRFGPFFYLVLTGNTLADYKDQDTPSLVHTVAAFSSAITSPCAGIGYFLVFLCIQKGAYTELTAHVNLAYEMCMLCTSNEKTSVNTRHTANPDSLTAPICGSIDAPSALNAASHCAFVDRASSMVSGDGDELFNESEMQSQGGAVSYRMSFDSGAPSMIEYLRVYELMDDDELMREIAKYGVGGPESGGGAAVKAQSNQQCLLPQLRI